MTDTPLVQPEAGSNDPVWIRKHSERIASGVNIAIRNLNTKPSIETGTSAPATTPAKVGDIFIDTSGAKAYVSTGTSSSSDWEQIDTAGGGVSAINDLSDVTITAAASGDFLRHNGTAWVDQTIQDGDIPETAVTQHEAALSVTESQISDFGTYLTDITGENLSSLSDVTITAIASGEVLKWTGSAWVNNTLAEAGIATSSHTHATTDITSGTFADARIAETNVTQHEAAIDHDALTNFVANEHINHGSVSITAGNGLTGGGTIAANRTINVVGGTGITVNANDVEVDFTAVQAQDDQLQDIADLTIAAGDIIYGSAANTLSNLAKGSDGEVLTLASGVPSWAAAAGGGISNTAAILWYDLAKGTNGPGFSNGDWRTVQFDQESDPSSIVALSSNQFTFAATGTYIVQFDSHWKGSNGAAHVRCRNVTQSSDVEPHTNWYEGGNPGQAAWGWVIVVTSASDAYEIQVYPDNNNISSNDDGNVDNPTGYDEVFHRMWILRVA